MQALEKYRNRSTALNRITAAAVLSLAVFAVSAFIPAAASGPAVTSEASPVPGVCFAGKIIDVHDGDTLTFSVTTTYQVRLLDCWAPELNEAGGIESRDALTAAAKGREGKLMIPFNKTGRFGDEMSFERVLGRVWIEDGSRPVDLSKLQVETGRATLTRPKK